LIYPTGWTCHYTASVTTSRVALIDRPCVIKSITFTIDNALNSVVEAKIYDGDTELFSPASAGLANRTAPQCVVLFPASGLRIENSLEIEASGASASREIKDITVLFQAGPSDSV
jgi:hypothetical protein